MSATPLADLFLARCALTHGAREPLEAALRSAWERARTSWPGVPFSVEHSVAHLAARLPAGEDPAAFLASVHSDDLYLAAACAAGVDAALALFETRLLSLVPMFLSRLSPAAVLVEDVKQLLRTKLFVATEDAPARIADYSGEGSLTSWLRVVAMRTALSLLRKKTDRPLDESSEDDGLLDQTRDPELDYIRGRYQPDFKAAFQSAMADLPVEQRNMLRLHFIDGLNIDKIGALFQVHRSTAARWLQSARAAVLDETRRRLQERLQLQPHEMDSLVRLLHRDLDVSISGALRASRD